MTAAADPRDPDRPVVVQLRLIIALVLRGLIVETSPRNGGVFGLLFRPASIILFLYILYSVFHRLTPQGMPLLAFLVTGWLAWFMFMGSFKDILGIDRRNAKLMMFPHISSLDFHLSNFVLEWFIYTYVFLIFTIITVLIERTGLPAEPLKVMLSFWSVAVIGGLLGVILGSIARVVPAIDYLTMPIRRLGHFTSGVLVTGADTPSAVLPYLTWNPLFHALELMREAWWPAYVSPFADAGYVLRCIFFMAALGLVLERGTRRFIRH
jgi:capsular polysaccharide transport system permease protein